MERIVKIFMFIVALCFTAPLSAQFDFAVQSAVGAGMGGVSTVLRDAGSAMENVAGLAETEGQWVQLSFRQFPKVKGMNQAGMSLHSSLPHGGIGLGMTYYGDAEYHEERVTVGYALPVGDDVALGVAFHYLHSGTSDPYYDPYNGVTFSIGVRYSLSRRMMFGFRAYNPLAIKGETPQAVRTPALFNLGVAYLLTDELLAVMEVEKNSYQPTTLRFGLQYSFFEDYSARMGMSTAPIIYTFGLGMQRRHLGGDLAVQVHSVLGILPQLMLSYHF